MQLVVVQKLVKTVCPGIVLLILPMHYIDVVDELCEEALHALGCRVELHDFVQRSIAFRLGYLSMYLEVLLEALQSRRWVKVLPVQPVQLLVNVLLREDEDVELLAFDQIWAFGNLLDKHAKEIASFLQKLLAVVAKVLLLGQRWYVEPG